MTEQLHSPDIWATSIKFLKEELSELQFNSWISPLKVNASGKQLILLAPSDFFIQWLKNRYLSNIRKAIKRADPANEWEIKLTLNEFEKPQDELYDEIVTDLKKVTNVKKSLDTTFNSNLNSNYTFNNFIVGKANQIPYAAANAIAENSSNGEYNPFFVYGGVGLGKTHLMQAIGNDIIAKNPKARALYVTSEDFVRNYVHSISNKKTASFQKFYRSLDVLMIDDIQFFANKTQSQEEFFHTFNTLLEGNKQIILTSDRLPRNVDKLDDRLQSRFGCGLSLHIDPPGLEMRVAILQKKALTKNVNLASDVAFYISQNLIGNIRDLEGALNRVITYSRFHNITITIELCKDVLKDILLLQDRIVSIENIQKHICEHFHLKLSDLLSKSRARIVSHPRQIAMYLCKELTKQSLPTIGKAFGNRDHSTVIHAHKSIKNLIKDDIIVGNTAKELIRKIIG